MESDDDDDDAVGWVNNWILNNYWSSVTASVQQHKRESAPWELAPPKLVVDNKSLSAEALTKHVVETGPGNKIHSYIKITSAETFKAD